MWLGRRGAPDMIENARQVVENSPPVRVAHQTLNPENRHPARAAGDGFYSAPRIAWIAGVGAGTGLPCVGKPAHVARVASPRYRVNRARSDAMPAAFDPRPSPAISSPVTGDPFPSRAAMLPPARAPRPSASAKDPASTDPNVVG